MDKEKIRKTILEEVQKCEPNRSICPSQVAKALEPDEGLWRRELRKIRQVAQDMAQNGEIDILRKGKPQDPHGEIKGVIRLRARSNLQGSDG